VILLFKHLGLVEREKLYGMLEKGFSRRKIARVLGRSQSSISREVERNTKWGVNYLPCLAQARYKRIGDRQRYKAPLKGPQIFLFVREKLRAGWSPETISGRIELEISGVSITPETIYRYIYSSKTRKSHLAKYLCFKHGRRRKQTGRSVRKYSKIPNAISIDNRAKYISCRRQLGHWESDLVEGPRSSKHVLSVTVERATRYTMLSRLVDKKSTTKNKHLVSRMKKIPAQMVRTLTLDNGAENTNHIYLSQQLNINVYFCHPYHSWEKGTVENTNGRIRRYIPKGTDIKEIPDEKINQLEYILNNTPRKCLGYLTPYEKMSLELGKISKLT
jgi:IS30 family transposase